VSSGLSGFAGACPVVAAAVVLAEWAGEGGVPVTSGGSLRPAEVGAAAAALGIPRQKTVRRAADVPEVHRPWLVAVAAGLVAVEDNHAVLASRLDDPLAAWWAGLQALLAVEAADVFDADPRSTAMVIMDVLTAERVDRGYRFKGIVEYIMYERGDWRGSAKPQRHGRLHPAEAGLAMLRLFGAVEGMLLTPLGTWAHTQLRQVLPPQITPELPAADLLGLLAGTNEVDAWDRAGSWFGERTTDQLVTELVDAATGATPAERITAVNLIRDQGDDAAAALHAAASVPNLGAHARHVAHLYELAPRPSTEDLVWLAAEHAHAELVHHGLAAARYIAMDALYAADIDLDTGGVKRIADSGHPHAAAVAEALTSMAGTAVPVQQLRISLSSQCWRRVLVTENTTLELLHHMIMALFGWDGDHLHAFTVGARRYADAFHGLEETVPEDTMRLHQALTRPKTGMSYIYDFGATWRHEIVLEKVLTDHPLTHPECHTGEGDNPTEYYDPDDPADPVPFDAEAINKILHKLAM
jgi:hypothetical protein